MINIKYYCLKFQKHNLTHLVMLKINLTICSKSGITLSIQNIHSKNLCNRMVVLFYFIYLFILINYFWLRWVFVAMCRLLIVVASLVVEHGL